jgi:hypothetical protein
LVMTTPMNLEELKRRLPDEDPDAVKMIVRGLRAVGLLESVHGEKRIMISHVHETAIEDAISALPQILAEVRDFKRRARERVPRLFPKEFDVDEDDL